MLRSGEDGEQLRRFLVQLFHSTLRDDACFNQEFQPKHRLIGFFDHDPNLGYELGLRARPADGTVICRGARGTSKQLPS